MSPFSMCFTFDSYLVTDREIEGAHPYKGSVIYLTNLLYLTEGNKLVVSGL